MERLHIVYFCLNTDIKFRVRLDVCLYWRILEDSDSDWYFSKHKTNLITKKLMGFFPLSVCFWLLTFYHRMNAYVDTFNCFYRWAYHICFLCLFVDVIIHCALIVCCFFRVIVLPRHNLKIAFFYNKEIKKKKQEQK